MKNIIKDERGSLGFTLIVLLALIFFSGILLAFTSDLFDIMNITNIYDGTPLENSMSNESKDFGNAFILLVKFCGILVLGRIALYLIVKQQEIANRGE